MTYLGRVRKREIIRIQNKQILSQPPNNSQPRIGKLTNCPNRPTIHQVFSHRARWRRQPQSLPTADSCPLSLTTGLRHDHVIKPQSLFREFSTTTPTQRGFIIVYFPPVFSPQNAENTPFRRGIKNHKNQIFKRDRYPNDRSIFNGFSR